MNIKKPLWRYRHDNYKLSSNLQAEEVEAVVELPDYNVVGQFHKLSN